MCTNIVFCSVLTLTPTRTLLLATRRRLWKCNDLDCVVQQDAVKEEFASGRLLRFMADFPLATSAPAPPPQTLAAQAVPRAQPAGAAAVSAAAAAAGSGGGADSGERAIFLAPLDCKAFDKLDIRQTFPTELPPSARGKVFNRYPDIIPSPSSQVRLSKIPGEDASEYINANYIKSRVVERAYIAASAPTDNTVNDWWRMIWDERSNHRHAHKAGGAREGKVQTVLARENEQVLNKGRRCLRRRARRVAQVRDAQRV